MLTTSNEPAHLVRGLGLLDAAMIVMGSMIGSGIFITSAESARLVAAPGWLLTAWAIAGALTIAGALCCAELAAMMPQAGGQYVFLREAFGRLPGFLFGWALFLVIQTGTIAAVAIAFANFTGVLTDYVSAEHYLLGPTIFGHYAISLSTQQLVAAAVVILLTLTNTLGLQTGKWIQNILTSIKTVAFLGMIAACLVLGWRSESAAFTASWWDPAANGWNGNRIPEGLNATGALLLILLLGKAMVGPLFSQSAWNNVTFAGGEVRDPGRNLPRALLIGCAAVAILYVLANLGYVVTLALREIQQAPDNRVAAAALQKLFGAPGTLGMAIFIMISTFGCANGLILAGARVYYAMARDGLFFRRVSALNPRNVPAAALLAQGCWTVMLTLPRTVQADPATGTVTYGNVYSQLLEYVISADLVFYILMVSAVIVLRFRWPAAVRPYRAWGYPAVPVAYVVAALLIVVDLAYLAPLTSGIGYAIVCSGVPAYFIWARRGRS